MCRCELCERHRRHREIRERRDVDELIALTKELEEDLIHTEMDRDMAESTLSGDFPWERYRLEKALSKIDRVDDETLQVFQAMWERDLPVYDPALPDRRPADKMRPELRKLFEARWERDEEFYKAMVKFD